MIQWRRRLIMMATIFSGYLQWFFRLSAVSFLGVSWRTLVWRGGGCFYKVVGHRVSSCIQVVLLCWCFPRDILLFRSGSISGHFQWLFLTFIYHYIYIIIHFCLVFVHLFGFFTIVTYVHLVSDFAFLDLVYLLLLINLPCII